MAKIKNVKGRQVFDSRGNPTVEAEVLLDNNISASAISPSGASTGAFEAHELRDQDKNNFLGKSVNTAIENINNQISSKLINLNSDDQENIEPKIPDYYVVNTKVISSNGPLSFSAGVSNIFNEKYYDFAVSSTFHDDPHFGTQSVYPLVERNAFISLGYTF